MINYETILSLFDDKLTLLQYLTKIEEALKNEQLTDITVTQTDASHVYFTFVFEDGSTIDTPTFTLPQGEQGEQGIQGISVTNAEIDASGHLIITLSNGNTIDAGATGLEIVKASDIDSEEASEYYVLKADGDGGATWGRVTAGDIADNNHAGYYLKSTGHGFADWGKFEIAGTLVTSGGATAGQVLTADGSNKASWETIPAQTPEGTAIKSTGETSGKVLTADGSGGASWQNASGGTTLTEQTNAGNKPSLALILAIVKNSKGRIKGNINWLLSNGVTVIGNPNNIIYAEQSYFMYNEAFAYTVGTTHHMVTMTLYINDNGSIGSQNVEDLDVSAGTVTTRTVTYSTSYSKVRYWNDTQITQL